MCVVRHYPFSFLTLQLATSLSRLQYSSVCATSRLKTGCHVEDLLFMSFIVAMFRLLFSPTSVLSFIRCTDWHSWPWRQQSADSDRQSRSHLSFPRFGLKKKKTNEADRRDMRFLPASSLTCIYSLMMSVKCSHECLKQKTSDQWGWWCCKVKCDSCM